MYRTEGIKRTPGHEGKLTYDIFHVWPHDFVQNGVKFLSTLHVYLATPAKDATVGLWVPGGPQGERRKMNWGDEWYVPSPTWAQVVTAVSFDNVPLHLIWEFTPGKA